MPCERLIVKVTLKIFTEYILTSKAKEQCSFCYSPKTHHLMIGILRSASYVKGDNTKTATIKNRYITTGGNSV